MAPGKLLVLTALALHAAPSRPSEYVDARVCAACHRQIAQDYSQTGMGKAFYRPAPLNTIENYAAAADFYHEPSDTHFSMTQRAGDYFQKRWQIGFDGKPTNVEELKIDYIMGSGNHARSYLHRTPAGTLIELPLGWYSTPARWGMSPGSDSTHPRTRRFVGYKCMFCHNAYPNIPAGYDAPGSDPVFTGKLPEGIDCQRCHGPGGDHVRTAATRGVSPAAIRASIVNPARLSSKLQMETCMQCHLETSSGRIPAWLQRFNRGPFSFTPGEPLENFAIAFDHAPGTGHDDKFEAVNSVYRLRQSRCFLQSAGALTCQTCHNPHKVPRGEDAVRQYSAVCRQCHATLVASAPHTASANCIECHMPRRRAEDTPGMIMTDHLIQRRLPAGNLLAEFREPPPKEYKGPVVPYYPSPLPATAENALYRAVAQVGQSNNLEGGLPDFARELQRQKPTNAEFYIIYGDALRSAGKDKDAATAYAQAVQLSPRSVRALRAFGTEPALKQALALAPGDPETWYRYGLLDLSSGRLPQSTEKIQKAIDLDPSLPEKSRRLAEVLLQSGDLNRAAAAIRDALRIDPYDEDAWDLAGRILTGKGETVEAMHNFEKAVRLRPQSGTFLYDYALALARANRFDEAEKRADESLRADDKLAEAHELRGGLFERKGQLSDAAREYRRALELKPDLPRVRQRLMKVQNQ